MCSLRNIDIAILYILVGVGKSVAIFQINVNTSFYNKQQQISFHKYFINFINILLFAIRKCSLIFIKTKNKQQKNVHKTRSYCNDFHNLNNTTLWLGRKNLSGEIGQAKHDTPTCVCCNRSAGLCFHLIIKAIWCTDMSQNV